MGITTDKNNPDLGWGADEKPVPQNKVYLVLSQEEIAKGYVKPYRDTYRHTKVCGQTTKINSPEIAATYARDPYFYGGTYCVHCGMHRPLNEFNWEPDGEIMDPHQWPPEEHERIAELRKSREINKMLKMDDLKKCFEDAINNNNRFVGVLVQIKDNKSLELIINQHPSLKSKLDYYLNTYDGSLNHKHSSGIKIVGFKKADSLTEIEELWPQ